ncbi:MAG TPA: suppressor of fused domain protein [Fimbriiglobus sp.]
MDYKQFYETLYAPLAASIGPIDKNTIVAIIGFDAGGPLNFCTIGVDSGSKIITYVSCELAVREEQVPAKQGGYRYEFLSSCNDEKWVRKVLTNLGRMSMDVGFDHGHTVDIGPVVNKSGVKSMLAGKPRIQGVLFQRECTAEFEGVQYGVMRCVGITRPEVEYALSAGSAKLVARLKEASVWPNTLINRDSVV